MDDMIGKLVGYAKQMAAENNIELDGSDNSLKLLDGLLNEYCKQVKLDKSEGVDQEGLNGIILSFGAYVGEVLRARVPKANLQWMYGTPTAGGGENIYLRNEEVEVYVIDWVAKQISFGRKESILKKYKSWTESLQ